MDFFWPDGGVEFGVLWFIAGIQANVFCELYSCLVDLETLNGANVVGIILSGGPSSVYEEGSPHVCAGFFDWAKKDPKIAGFNPWHFANRSGPQLRGGWDQRLGAVSMPSVVAKLQEIGKHISGGGGA